MAGKKYDVIVIGAGSSGIMAAITAARQGAYVLLLEHKERIGKKILATGNGKCNFTNDDMSLAHFRGDKGFIESVLPMFDQKHTLAFFHEIGILPKCKNGYYYPNSEQASSILFALSEELKRLGVRILTDTTPTLVQKKKDYFEVGCNKQTFLSRSLIWATGLLASPKLGSDGSSFSHLKAMGHHFTPIVPALCAFYATGTDFGKISGVRVQANLQLEIDKKIVAGDTGELQLTDYGISGIPVFQISRYASYGLYHKKNVLIHINFMPDYTEEQLQNEIEYRILQLNNHATPQKILNGFLPQKLIPVIAKACGWKEDMPMPGEHKKEILRLLHQIMDFEVQLTKPRDYEFSQICAGGISSEEVHADTLESKLVPKLYFAGELLDVDGICGGYNLQWAWASGYVAGTNAAKRG